MHQYPVPALSHIENGFFEGSGSSWVSCGAYCNFSRTEKVLMTFNYVNIKAKKALILQQTQLHAHVYTKYLSHNDVESRSAPLQVIVKQSTAAKISRSTTALKIFSEMLLSFFVKVLFLWLLLLLLLLD